MSASLFLAIVTVAVLGIGLIGFLAVMPIGCVIAGLYCLWDASNYRENLAKEYDDYKKNTRDKFLKSLYPENYYRDPYEIYAPSWFDQKYTMRILAKRRDKENEIKSGKAYLQSLAYYEIFIKYMKDTGMWSRRNIEMDTFAFHLMELCKDNPNDKTLKEYCMKVHNLEDWDDGCHVLKVPYDTLDDSECEYLTIDEFAKTSYSKSHAKSALIAGIVCLALGIFFFFYFGINIQ